MKTRSSAKVAATFLSISAVLSGCNSAQSDWAKASRENTASAYQNFLEAHPKDEHVPEAKAMMLEFQDDAKWQEAQHTGTAAAYQAYLQQFPQGNHAALAKDTMTAINTAAEWKTAQDAGTAAAVQAFLQKYPSGPETDQAKAKLKDLTGYRVHLANESSDAKARRKLAQLKSRLREQASSLAITRDSNDKSFSIDSPGMTQQEATSVCQSIRRKHEACQVVKQ